MTAADWALLAVGAGLVVVGLASLRWGRMHARGPEEATPRPTLLSPSVPTRFVVGLAAMFAGYHLMAWALPPAWMALRVPMGRAWIVALVSAGSIGCSIAIDLVEGRRGA